MNTEETIAALDRGDVRAAEKIDGEWRANEEAKASIYARVTLRCDTCRERGRHDGHKQKQRAKARRNDKSPRR